MYSNAPSKHTITNENLLEQELNNTDSFYKGILNENNQKSIYGTYKNNIFTYTGIYYENKPDVFGKFVTSNQTEYVFLKDCKRNGLCFTIQQQNNVLIQKCEIYVNDQIVDSLLLDKQQFQLVYDNILNIHQQLQLLYKQQQLVTTNVKCLMYRNNKIKKQNYYVGNIDKQRQANGFGQFNYKNGNIYTGFWKNGKTSGLGYLFDKQECTKEYAFWFNDFHNGMNVQKAKGVYDIQLIRKKEQIVEDILFSKNFIQSKQTIFDSLQQLVNHFQSQYKQLNRISLLKFVSKHLKHQKELKSASQTSKVQQIIDSQSLSQSVNCLEKHVVSLSSIKAKSKSSNSVNNKQNNQDEELFSDCIPSPKVRFDDKHQSISFPVIQSLKIQNPGKHLIQIINQYFSEQIEYLVKQKIDLQNQIRYQILNKHQKSIDQYSSQLLQLKDQLSNSQLQYDTKCIELQNLQKQHLNTLELLNQIQKQLLAISENVKVSIE